VHDDGADQEVADADRYSFAAAYCHSNTADGSLRVLR